VFINEEKVRKKKEMLRRMKTVNSQSSIAQRMVEKYLKLSDFIIYIFSNFDVILDEPEQELKDYLAHFLISLQDCVDFEITI
jgi:hypothetical protein